MRLIVITMLFIQAFTTFIYFSVIRREGNGIVFAPDSREAVKRLPDARSSDISIGVA